MVNEGIKQITLVLLRTTALNIVHSAASDEVLLAPSLAKKETSTCFREVDSAT